MGRPAGVSDRGWSNGRRKRPRISIIRVSRLRFSSTGTCSASWSDVPLWTCAPDPTRPDSPEARDTPRGDTHAPNVFALHPTLPTPPSVPPGQTYRRYPTTHQSP